MRARLVLLAGVAVTAVVVACLPLGSDRVTGITGVGKVAGLVYLDRNGDHAFGAADTVLPGVRVVVVPHGTRDSSHSKLTDQAGNFEIPDLPVGQYSVAIDTAGVAGDSIGVARITRDTFTLHPGDSVGVQAALSFPELTIAELRLLTTGRKGFIEGIALYNIAATGGGIFGDSTVNVTDTSGSIRMTNVRGTPILAGDSLRVLGQRSSRAGQATLDRPATTVLQSGAIPPFTIVSSAVAASASGGKLDAALVQVLGAVVVNAAAVPGALQVTVNDNSGPLVVRLDSSAFPTGFPANVGLTGNVFDFTGVLVPTGAGDWQLQPRGTADVVPTVQTFTVRQARAAGVGTRMFVTGLALTNITNGNPNGTFGDSTLHVADTSLAIRIVNAHGISVTIADSMRIFAVRSTRDGQPALDSATWTKVGAGANVAGLLKVLTTFNASKANALGGTADAALVRVDSAVTIDAATVPGGLQLHVNDGSGLLEVRLDSTAFAGGFPANIGIIGDVFSFTGVLVPSGAGTWRLQPRSTTDVVEQLSVVTVRQARAAPVGTKLLVSAVALTNVTAGAPNGTFGDSTLHVADTSLAIRLVNAHGTFINVGDSVRILATKATRSGQPTLDNATWSSLGTGASTAALTKTLTTVQAAGAVGPTGTADAALVQVLSATTIDTATVAGGYRLTVNDNSGPLEVRLDSIAFPSGFPANVGIVGDVFSYTGVLVPNGSGGWRLKPRTTTDVVEQVAVVTVRQARGLAVGRKVQLTAVALTSITGGLPAGTFGDSTLHVADSSLAIRLVNAHTTTIAVGDSVRISATRALRNGQPTLDNATWSPLGTGASTAALTKTLTTVQAAGAVGPTGTADAALVHVLNATTIDTATVAGGYRLTVNDNSGPLEVRLDSTAFAGGFPANIGIIGDVFTYTGVLVPNGSGGWRLLPRNTADVVEQVAIVTVRQARALTVGRKVQLTAVALTSISGGLPAGIFGDSTLHVADTSLAIRLVNAHTTTIAVGDSVRISATRVTRDGQPALDNVSWSSLGTGASTAALTKTLTTVQAAGAIGPNGTADAALVHVLNATTIDTATVAGGYRLTVNDNSGPLEVRLDSTAFVGGFPTDIGIVGNVFTYTGVLVPNGSGGWRLQPRSTADVVEQVAIVTVRQARALTVGRKVQLTAVALTSITGGLPAGIFGDSTLHVADTSLAIRLVNAHTTTIAVGDSVRISATRAVRNGQPTLDQATWVPIISNASTLALLKTLTSAQAAAGVGPNGTSDAALVRVQNATTIDTATVAGGFLVTVNDNSGPLGVLLDSTAFPSLPADIGLIGNVFTYSGVLVPQGGGVWRLQPRSSADVVEQIATVTVRQARALTVGTKAFVTAVALTDVTGSHLAGTFGDSTLHMADTSLAIRLMNVRNQLIAVGDTMRIFAVRATRDAQPSFDQVVFTSQTAGTSSAVPLKTLSTVNASSATGASGTADAALVRVLTATVSDTATVPGAFRIHVNDGTGLLEVRLDSLTFSGGFPAKVDSVGAKFDIVGVLVPASATVWRMLPRSTSDFTLKP